MKTFLIFIFLSAFHLHAQTPLTFDLTVRVSKLEDKTAFVPDVRVLVKTADSTVFEGCTDANGEIYVDTGLLLPNNDYVILLQKEGFFADKRGVRLTTRGLEYSQNFVVETSLLRRFKCWFYPCYDPSVDNARQNRRAIAESLAEMQQWEEETKGIRITRLTVFTHGTETDAVLREARELQSYLKKHLRSFEVEAAIVVEAHDNGMHASCVGVKWLPDVFAP